MLFEHLGSSISWNHQSRYCHLKFTLWPQHTWFIKDHISIWKCFWGDLQNLFIWNPYCWYQKRLLFAYIVTFNVVIMITKLGYSLRTLLSLQKLSNIPWFNSWNLLLIGEDVVRYQAYPVFVFVLKVNEMLKDTCQWLRYLILAK